MYTAATHRLNLDNLIMGRITEQLTELIKRMEESDRRLKELTDQFIADTRKALDELERLPTDD